MVEAEEQEAEREARHLHRADRPPTPARIAVACSRGADDRERATAHDAKYPAASGIPASAAPLAPGNDITASVWPAKLCRRSTMNQPATAAMSATIVPASSAFDHEREQPQLVEVRDRVEGEVGVHACWCACRSPWWAGASGEPTTTSRPSDVRSTSTGTP